MTASTLPVYRAAIQPEWIDYNGHMRDAYYGLVLSYAIDAAMDHLGMDASYREATGCTLYTLESHLHYLHEVKSTDDLAVAVWILECDRKRVIAGASFMCPRLPDAVASAEILLMHVHQGEKPASAAFPEAIAARLAALTVPAAARAEWMPGSRKIELKRR